MVPFTLSLENASVHWHQDLALFWDIVAMYTKFLRLKLLSKRYDFMKPQKRPLKTLRN